MKICIAQTKSLKGNVKKNIENHLKIIERASLLNSDVIIFPELSITGYEPELAKKLASKPEHSRFKSFQALSDKHKIVIGIGIPTKSIKGIHISMLIFQPNKQFVVYSKQILHEDEFPYFSSGENQIYLNIKDEKLAIGICYETLQREHFLNTYQKGASIYIASVAKSKDGIEKAYNHYSKISREFKTPVLMSNCFGYCDTFMSVGKSAVWNKNGELLAQLDSESEGMLIYNTKTELTEIDQPKLIKGELDHLDELFQIYLNGKYDLEQKGIYQWNSNYPTRSIIEKDLIKGVLYILKNNKEIIGAINISEEQEPEYKLVEWVFNSLKVLVIHRLIIDPKYQKKGYAQKLMDFAEDFASKHHYTSIRLDAYSQNERVLQFYKKRKYLIRGQVYFPERQFPFYAMEKKL